MVDILKQLGTAFGGNPPVEVPKAEATPTIVRNNNPGALEDGAFARSQKGYVEGGGRFAKFATPEDGARAQEALLRSKNYRGKSVVAILDRYTPPTAENSGPSRANYIGYVAKRLGLDPNAPVPDSHVGVLAQAMREFETGAKKKIQYTPYGPANRSAPAAKGGGMPQDFLAGLESTLAPESKASQNVTSNASAIFGSDAEMNRRQANVEQSIQQQGATIGVLNEATQALQAVQLTAMQNQVDDTRALSEEIQSGVEQVKQRVRPIFEARQRVADQLTKIATMNPLERGLRGIFDLNYDQKYLQAQADRLQQAAEISTSDFKMLDELNQVAIREVSRRYGLETAMPELAQQQANADLGIMGLTLTHATAALESLKTGVSNQVQLIQAKRAAREDMMSRLDGPTLLAAANDAKAKGGITMIGGVEVSYHELREAFQGREMQDLQAEAYRMSIANQRMDYAEKYATNYARLLTRPQLEEAIRNGGVHNGVQIPQDVLTNLYAASNQQAAQFAEQQAMKTPSYVVAQSASAIAGYAADMHTRLNATVGPQALKSLSPLLGQIGASTQAIADAVKAGTMTPEQAQLQLAGLGKLRDAYEKQADQVILNSVGGDKKAAGYVKGFMTGTQLSQGTALEGLTYFAIKGNMPDGMMASPAAKQLFQMARAEVLKLRESNKDISIGQLQSAVQKAIENRAQDTLGEQRYQAAFGNLPMLAKASGLHFGKVGTKEWKRVVSTAKNDAVVAAAAAANVTPDQYLQILQKGAPLEDSQEAKAAYSRVQKATGIYNATEQRLIMEGLDDLPQIAAGRRNSSLYRDALEHPSMLQYGDAIGRAASQKGFGDYLVGPIGEGGFATRMEQTANIAGQTQDALTRDVRTAGRQRAQMYRNDPVMRTGVVLSTIPGVGKSGAQALQPFIQSIAKANPDLFGTKNFGRANVYRDVEINEVFMKQDDAVFAALNATKFNDPNLEAYRKTAIKGFKQSATQEMDFMDKFMSAVSNASRDAANQTNRIVNPIGAPLIEALGQ
jgi:hypothetical protein